MFVVKPRFNRTIDSLRQLSHRSELKLYAFITSLIVMMLILIFYLLAAHYNTDQDSLGLGLLSLPPGSVSPLAIFLAGTALSIVMGSYMFMILVNRIERWERLHKKEVQQTKNDLLALASHQLRTPASGVKQYLGMVIEGYTGKLRPEQKRMLRKAYNSNERQIETINQLLYVAQAEAGELRLMPSTFNLVTKIGKVIQDLQKQAEENDIKIRFSHRKGIYVHADKRFIRMIIENLISNAIKYSYPSSEVKVSVGRVGKQAFVRVKDSGVGIAKNELSQLFLKFSRIENELSSVVGGSGMGLFLSQRLARAHEGTIRVESEKSKGSTFTLILPVRSAQDEAKAGFRSHLPQTSKGAHIV